MTMFGQPRRHFSECGSTNDAAREWALDESVPAPSGAVVTADFQTHGRGQRGHQWQAGSGQSALMSFVYRLPPQAETALLGLMTAVAVAESLAALNFSPKIKWPNDILLDGGKAGGILVEVAAGVAILGIGINVNQQQFEGASEFTYPPTSLHLVAGKVQSVESLVQEVGLSLTLWERKLRQEGALPIWSACRSRLAVGARVRRGEEEAQLTDIAMDGQALVRLPGGTFAAWTTVN